MLSQPLFLEANIMSGHMTIAVIGIRGFMKNRRVFLRALPDGHCI